MLTIQDVSTRYPGAFSALPVVYQADSCLEFYVDSGRLYARPSKAERQALGDWLAYYDLVHPSGWQESRVNR